MIIKLNCRFDAHGVSLVVLFYNYGLPFSTVQ